VALGAPSAVRLSAVTLTGVIAAGTLSFRRAPELRAELGVVRQALVGR
jgi:hypothetical protein